MLAPEGTMWIVAGTLCVVSFVRERALDLEGTDALRRAAPVGPTRGAWSGSVSTGDSWIRPRKWFW